MADTETMSDPTVETIEVTGDTMSGRSTPSAATIGNDIYLFGGAKDDWTNERVDCFNDIFKFDTLTNEMTRLEPSGSLPPASVYGAGAADEENGHFYIIGGSSFEHPFNNLVNYGELWRYSVADNSWDLAAPDDQGPGPRVRPNMWTYDGALYCFGGLDQKLGNHNDVWRFGFEEQRWELVVGDTDAVKPRYESVSGNTTTDGKVYALAGENMRAEEFRPVLVPGTIEIDLTTGDMHRIEIDREDDVDGRMRHQGAAAQIDGKLYLYGGDDPLQKVMGCGALFSQAPVGQTWIFDPSTAKWRLSANEGPKLKRIVGSAARGKLYVFGGYDFECVDNVGQGQVWNESIVVAVDPAGQALR